jgi:hypothetical protein
MDNPRWFTLRGAMPNPEKYVPVLDRYGEGWNKVDLDLVVSCFSDATRYRDFATRRWVEGIDKLRKYVRSVFRRFPEQHWQGIEVFPHVEPGVFSVKYAFKMASAFDEMVGEGYERIVVEDGRITLDDVFLRTDAYNVRVPVLDQRLNLLAVMDAPNALRKTVRGLAALTPLARMNSRVGT